MKESEIIQGNEYELPQVATYSSRDHRENHLEFVNNMQIVSTIVNNTRKAAIYADPVWEKTTGGHIEVYREEDGYLMNPISKSPHRPVRDRDAYKEFYKNINAVYDLLQKNVAEQLEDPALQDLYVKAANEELRRSYESRQKAAAELKEANEALERARLNRERAERALEEARQNRNYAELERDTVYNPFSTGAKAESAAEKVTQAEQALRDATAAITQAEQTLKDKQAADEKTEAEYTKAQKLAEFDSFAVYKEKARKFIKGFALGEMKRDLGGDTYPYLLEVDLFFAAAKTAQGFFNTTLEDNLIYKIAVADGDLPIYDLIIKNEEHVDTYTKYLHDKQAGKLTPEKEQEYREKLYKQAREAALYSEQFSEKIDHPETNAFYDKLHICDTSNQPRELSKNSPRGFRRLDASLQAHITGLENNWQIDDLGLLVAYNMARTSVAADSPDKEKFADRMNALYEKLDSSPLTDNRQRNEFLGQMRDLIAEGAAKGYIENSYVESFTRSHRKAVERNKLIEAGKEAAAAPLPPYGTSDYGVTEEDLKLSFAVEPENLLWGVHSGIGDRFIPTLPSEIEGEGKYREKAYKDSDIPQIMLPVSGVSGHGKVYKVQDKEGYEQFRQKALETCNEWDALIHDALPDHPLAQKMEATLKASTTNMLRRSCDGFTDVYLSANSPMYSGLKTLIADSAIVFNDKLGTLMEESKETFPVFDCIIQGDEHLQTSVDYQKEKESGKMTPERAEEYRRIMYAQAAALLPKVRQLSDTVVNNRPEADRLHALGITQNDPFQLGKYSARGCLSLEAGLEAEVHGLKNGWPIEDLAAISAFNFVRQRARGTYEHTSGTSFAGFKKFDPPKYPSEECRQYFDKMDALFQSFTQKTLQSKEDRLQTLNEMQKLITVGVEKKFLDNSSSVQNAMDLFQKARLRDVAIAKGKEPAVYEALGKNNALIFESQIEGQKAFETERSKVFLGRESAEHKALRESYEELSRAKKALGFPPTTEQLSAYLDQIDLVEHNARIYQEEKAGASSEAGQERLKGARKLESFAVKERKRFMDLLNRDKKPEDRISLKSFRKIRATEASANAMTELGKMGKLPSKGPERDKAMSMMADVLVHQFATSRLKTTSRVFEEKGIAVLKQEVMKNSAFQKMADGYLNGKKTGTELCDDLMSGKCMQKIGKMREKLAEKQEERLKQLEAAKPKPKKKAAAKQA